MTKQKQKLITVKKKKKEDIREKLQTNRDKYIKELEHIETKYNGLLTAEVVVKEASKNNSPLHDWFDWDKEEASDKWLVHQARMLINSVRVTIDFDKGPGTYRKYLNVNINTSQNKPRRYYVSTKRVLKTKNLREQVLLRAVKEAEYWETQYQNYDELNAIFKGIKTTKRKLKKILS